MNWDSIKYIFQIPLSWFKKIHNMVFKSYGTDFMTVKEGQYGGLQIGINNEQFDSRVASIASTVTPSGVVKSVDGHNPDSNGAVSFGLTSNKYVKTNSSGHLTTDANNDVVTLPTNTSKISDTVKIINMVHWTGTRIQIQSRELTFVNGVLTSTTTPVNSYIETVVLNS